MRTSAVLWALIAGSFLAVPARGDDRSAATRALVQRLVVERASAIASVQHIADEREKRLLDEMAAKDRRLRTELRTRQAAQAELAKVTEERQRLVDEIAGRERQFAATIEKFRRQVESIAEDPRKREALERYADGDRAGGYEALVELQKAAETAAREEADKRAAADLREIGALAQDRKDRGEMSTAEVIEVFEKAQALDPEDSWGWIELRRLYQEAGRLPDARHAAEQALRHAQSDRERAAAEMDLGDVLVTSGDLPGARLRFEKALKINEQLLKTNPTSADAQSNLSVSLSKLGDVLVALGDLAGARDRFSQSLKIDELLAAANPTSVGVWRDLSISLDKLGDLLIASGDLMAARIRFEESLKIRERLSRDNPTSIEAQRDLSISLSNLGNVLLESGDLAGARDRFNQSLEIDDRLAAANPTSAEAQHDLSVSLSNLGDVLFASGDLAGAHGQYKKNLKIRERLASENPESAEAQRALIVSLVKLGSLPGGELHLREALRIALDLQSKGRLAPSDAWMIDDLRKRVAATEKPTP